MIRKLFISLTITVSCLTLSSAALANNTTSKVEPAKREKVGEPAGNAGAQAKRAVVTPNRAAKDRSWSSDTVMRERVPMNKASKKADRKSKTKADKVVASL